MVQDFLKGFREGWRETRPSKRLIVGAFAGGAILATAALVATQPL